MRRPNDLIKGANAASAIAKAWTVAQDDRPHPTQRYCLANPGAITRAIGASEQMFGARQQVPGWELSDYRSIDGTSHPPNAKE